MYATLDKRSPSVHFDRGKRKEHEVSYCPAQTDNKYSGKELRAMRKRKGVGKIKKAMKQVEQAKAVEAKPVIIVDADAKPATSTVLKFQRPQTQLPKVKTKLKVVPASEPQQPVWPLRNVYTRFY